MGGLRQIYHGALRPFAAPLIADRMLAEAEQATDLSYWGGRRWSEERFRHRFAALCEAIEAEADLTETGRARAHSRLHTTLCSRLRYLAWREAHPDADRPIIAPLVGTGLPRAGTTFLHNILAQDPAHLSATAAEAAIPLLGEDATPDDRDALYETILAYQGFLGADITSIHPFGARMPEECFFLQEGACVTAPMVYFHVPHFAAALADAIGDLYEWQIGRMQEFQHGRSGVRWSLKAPGHLSMLDAMFTAFPDARVYLNHRDPAKVIPSIASLFAAIRSLFSERAVDRHAIGAQMLTSWATALTDSTRWRDDHPEIEIVDVHYRALIANPLAIVREIYDRFGLPLAPETADRMSRFIDANHHGKGPVRRYALADYGLDEGMIDAAFASYFERYGVARETRV